MGCCRPVATRDRLCLRLSVEIAIRGFTFTSEQPNCACNNGDQLLHNRASPMKQRECMFNMQWMAPSSPKQWEHFQAVRKFQLFVKVICTIISSMILKTPQNNETSNSKISPFVVMYMAIQNFSGFEVSDIYPSLEIEPCWVLVYLQLKWLQCWTV